MGGQDEVVACFEAGVATGTDVACHDDDVFASPYFELVTGNDVGLYALDVVVGHQADVHAFDGAGQVGDVVGVYGQIAPCRHQAAVDDVAFEFEGSTVAGVGAQVGDFHYKLIAL